MPRAALKPNSPLPAFPIKMAAFSEKTRKQRKSSGWSPERRARHAAAIRIWAPWSKSTGPKTPAGKVRVSQNACKPLKRLDPDRIVGKALRQQARYITEINRYSALKKISGQNKLLKKRVKNHLRNRHKALEKQGRKITNDLISALAWHRVVGILATLSPHALHLNKYDKND